MKIKDSVVFKEFLIIPRRLENSNGVKEWRWMRYSKILWDIVEMWDLTPAMPTSLGDRYVVKYVAKKWMD